MSIKFKFELDNILVESELINILYDYYLNFIDILLPYDFTDVKINLDGDYEYSLFYDKNVSDDSPRFDIRINNIEICVCYIQNTNLLEECIGKYMKRCNESFNINISQEEFEDKYYDYLKNILINRITSKN